MAGRADEQAAVATAWQAGLVVLVEAEAGMGKSRLLVECLAGQPGRDSRRRIGTLSLDSTSTVFETASMHNGGTMTLQRCALNIHVGAEIAGQGRFMQVAGVTTVDGRLQAMGGINIAGGVLKRTGTVEGTVTVGAAAQWKPGN